MAFGYRRYQIAKYPASRTLYALSNLIRHVIGAGSPSFATRPSGLVIPF